MVKYIKGKGTAILAVLSVMLQGHLTEGKVPCYIG